MSIAIGIGFILFGLLHMVTGEVGRGLLYAIFGVFSIWVGFAGNKANNTPKRKITDAEKMQNAMGMQHEQMRNQEPLFKSSSSSSSSSSSIFNRDSKW